MTQIIQICGTKFALRMFKSHWSWINDHPSSLHPLTIPKVINIRFICRLYEKNAWGHSIEYWLHEWAVVPFLLITRVETIRVSPFKSSWFEWLFVANYDCSNVSIGVGDFQLLFLHVLLYWTVISIVNALLYLKCLSLFHKYRPPDLITNKKNRFDHFRHLISADLWINADLIYK